MIPLITLLFGLCNLCTALTKGTYKIIGRIMSFSIVHGGPLPTFFSRHLYAAIVEGYAAVKCSVEDVLDRQLQHNLEQV